MARRKIQKQEPEEMWHQRPELIRQFLEKRPDYEQLCIEVTYILNKRLKEHGIEVSTITWRAKSLNSFLEKIQRKEYDEPLKEIQDFSGIRIVHLYTQDAQIIESIINDEFVVSEKVDKLAEKEPDRFGYLATHFIAALSKNSEGARYEDLKNLSFEIQVRTVLQDAWAIIDHHLAYKKEEEVPKHLLRKLLSIAAVIEMIDDNFNQIQQAIIEYSADLKKLSQGNIEEFLKNDLDLNSLLAYLSWKFPDIPNERDRNETEQIFDVLRNRGFSKLSQVDQWVNQTKDAAKKMTDILQDHYDNTPNCGTFRIIMSLVVSEEKGLVVFPQKLHKRIEKVISEYRAAVAPEEISHNTKSSIEED